MFTETLTSRGLISASRDRLALSRMASFSHRNPAAYMTAARELEHGQIMAGYRYMARVRALRLDPRRLP